MSAWMLDKPHIDVLVTAARAFGIIEEGEENDDTYTDRRWRWLRLRPIGERWVQRVAGVTARARSGDLSRDVFVLDEGDGGHAAVHAKPAKASSQGL